MKLARNRLSIAAVAMLALTVSLSGCAADGEDPEDVDPVEGSEAERTATTEDALTFYKKFVVRPTWCAPRPADVFCRARGYDGGSVAKSGTCTWTYTCRVRT